MRQLTKTPASNGLCFAAGTLIHTKEGLKPIEDIQVGDWVLSQPEETGAQAYKRVTRTVQHEDKAVYRVSCHKKDGDKHVYQRLIVTGSHPFYVVGQRKEEWWDQEEWDAMPKQVGWRRADLLDNLDIVLLANGETMRVSMVDPIWRTKQEGVGWIAAGPDAELGRLIDLRDGRLELDRERSFSDFMGVGDFGIRYETPELEDKWAYKCTVYNFEVEDFHTYYVGELGVWVHNAHGFEHSLKPLSPSAGKVTASADVEVGTTSADSHGGQTRAGKPGRWRRWRGNARWSWLAVLLGAMSAQAQPLSLSDLLERARASEPTFLGAKAAVSTAQAREDQAFGALLPQLSASAGTHANSRNYETRDDVTPRASDEYNNHSTQISLTQPLWRPADVAGLKQAKIMVAQAEYQLTAAEQELAARLVEAWFDLLAARDAKAFADQQVAALEQQWRVSARAEELGAGSHPLTEEALAKLEQAKADAAVAETDIELKRAAMEQWVGPLPEFTLPHLNGSVALIDPAAQALDVWLQEVEAGNPSVLAARQAYEAAEAEVRKQRAGHSPTLDLVASYGKNSQAVGGFPGQAGYDIKQGSIGVQLNVPLYSGGTQSAKVAEALAQEERASQEIEAARRSAVLAAKRAWFTWRGAVARAAAGAQSIRAARAELARTGRGSERGLQTRLEILQAEQQLRAGQRDFCKGRYDQIVSLIRLKAAAGTLLLSDVTGIDGLLVPLREAADPAPRVHIAEAGNR
ncbi:TolC family outer membrane protein [Pseudomonas indica]|uniref:TolC family outer membrane protein n=1 Tax=Pseudomonas indica TaxID=137658 RepID=UPI003FCFB75B